MTHSSSILRSLPYFCVAAALCFTNNLHAQSAETFAKIDGQGIGWKTLGEADFVMVNGDADTWTWEGSLVKCTGKPVGVTRSQKPYKNFELVANWRHLSKAGNSGSSFGHLKRCSRICRADNCPALASKSKCSTRDTPSPMRNRLARKLTGLQPTEMFSQLASQRWSLSHPLHPRAPAVSRARIAARQPQSGITIMFARLTAKSDCGLTALKCLAEPNANRPKDSCALKLKARQSSSRISASANFPNRLY